MCTYKIVLQLNIDFVFFSFRLLVKRLKNWLEIIFGDIANLFVVHFLLELKNFFLVTMMYGR